MPDVAAVRWPRGVPARAAEAFAEGLPDDVLQAVPEVHLESARLGRLPCRAGAWVAPTHVAVRTDAATCRVVEGVRPWRGMALFARAGFSAGTLCDGVTRYDGPVLDGDTLRQVSADIFVHRIQHGFGDRPDVVVVEFVGAGTLR